MLNPWTEPWPIGCRESSPHKFFVSSSVPEVLCDLTHCSCQGFWYFIGLKLPLTCTQKTVLESGLPCLDL